MSVFLGLVFKGSTIL